METNVFDVDIKIKDMYRKNKEDIEKLNEEAQLLSSTLTVVKGESQIQKDVGKKIIDIGISIKTLNDSNDKQQFYDMEFIELQETYKEELTKRKSISFMKKPKDVSRNQTALLDSYIKLLKKYSLYNPDFFVIKPKKASTVCKTCINCKSVNIIRIDSNREICNDCGLEEERSDKSTVNFKDISRVNINNKYYYERRVHFQDTIHQFQGKQNANIDERIYRLLEEKLTENEILINSPNKLERFKNVTREHIYIFLKETGFTKNYEDDMLIYSKLTGKKSHDISHIEARLMEDFDSIIKEYDTKYKDSLFTLNRKSFINSQIILYQLLKRYKYPCDRSDFNILKTLDRLAFHDTIIEEIFKTLGFNFTPLF